MSGEAIFLGLAGQSWQMSVLRYLDQHHEEILSEFQRIAELETIAA